MKTKPPEYSNSETIAGDQDLPPVANLSKIQANETALHLRTVVRKQLIEELDQFQEDGSASSYVDRWALEYRFLELEKYSRSLSKKLLPAEYCEPILIDIESMGLGVRSARAPLFLTPESGHYVHGPVLVYHALALCEMLVQSGDRIDFLEEMIMRKEVEQQIELIVWCDEESFEFAAPKKGDFFGSVTTVNGKKIRFSGTALTNRPVSLAAGPFNVPERVLEIVAPTEETLGCHQIRLDECAVKNIAEIQKRAGRENTAPSQLCYTASWIAYALTDTLAFGLSILRGSSDRALKMLQCKRLHLPSDLPEWISKADFLEIKMSAPRKRGPYGVAFIKGESRFHPVQQDPTLGMMVEIPVSVVRNLKS